MLIVVLAWFWRGSGVVLAWFWRGSGVVLRAMEALFRYIFGAKS
jgi:hypothetical protein